MRVSRQQSPSAKGSNEVAGDTAVTIKETTQPEKAPVTNYWRILSHRSTIDGFALLVGLLCAAGAGIALPLMNIVFGHLVGDFNGYFVAGSSVTEAMFKAAVSKNALYIVYLFIGKFALTYVSMFCFRTTGLRISAKLRLSYLDSLFAQPIQRLDEVSSGTVANTITTSANTIQMSISDKLHNLFMALALTITAYIIAFRYSWALTLVTSSALVFISLLYSVSTPIVVKQFQRVEKANAKAASIAGEIFSSIRAVFSLNAEKTLTTKYFSAVGEVEKLGLAMDLHQGIQLAPIFFAIYSSCALAFWFGLKLFREGHISNISTVITVLFSVLIVVSVLGAFAVQMLAISKAVSVSPEFFSMMDSKPTAREGLSEPDVSAYDDIRLDDISFAYPTRPNVQVLKGFNARFLKGKTTALVGPSGSGKSTIVALLERWYELNGDTEAMPLEKSKESKPSVEESEARPDIARSNTGIVSIGGRNVNETNMKWWRSRIGLVQQEPFLFNDTIFNNVAFGLIGTKWEHDSESSKLERVEKACQEAFADEFIQQLPDGYSSRVGENGIKLSGGQRQRLAIARSIIREPAILILDEATSSIDVRGERIVQKALERVSQGRTTIVIAHRLSTIRKADHIIVMREGRNLEEGTHEHLLSIPDGLYASLVRAQRLEGESQPTPDPTVGEENVHQESLEQTRTNTSNPQHADGTATTTYTQQGFFLSFGRFLYEQRRSWKLYILILTCAMGAGSAYSLQSWIFAQLIQVFQFTGHRLKERGAFWSLMFFILSLGIAVCYFTLGYTANHLSVHVSSVYRRLYFRDLLNNPISFFDMEGNASGSLMSRLSTDPKLIQELLGLSGVFPLISIFNMIGCIAIAFSFGWKMTLVVVFSAMPVIFGAAFVRIGYELRFEKWNSEVFSTSSQFATEAIGAFRTVTSLTMEDWIVRKYSDLLQDQVRKATLKATYACLVFALSDSLELAAMALTYWYGGQLLARREYNPLQFFVIYVAIVQGAQGAGQFFSFAPNIAQATAAANRILRLRHEVAERQQQSASRGQPQPLHLSNTKAGGGASIEFRGVTFQYPTRDTPIYRNLNLSIASGQFVAFVGPSGCGKTTIISLLERFYEPTSGCILFNGVDVRNIEISSYRRTLSLVAQEPRLFQGTVRENLVLGLETEAETDPQTEKEEEEAETEKGEAQARAQAAEGAAEKGETEAETETETQLAAQDKPNPNPKHNAETEAEANPNPKSKKVRSSDLETKLIQACQDAEIHDFIISLPEGYNTPLGINTSTTLSGGQKQRLCLARALLRSPTLLLLDEATSSLDSQSERLVQSAIDRLVSQRSMTVVAVAHRLATVQKADVIFVFGENRGGLGSRILEQDSHLELVNARGAYWQMCQEQALDR